MTLPTVADPLPLRTDADGTVRVGGTRVTLDTVIGAFLDGESAEGIAEAYPTVPLAVIYTVIAFYLNHRAEVDAYLTQREAEAREIQKEIESRFPPDGFRARLLARRKRS